MKHYKAPWSLSLIFLSSLVTVVCLGATVFIWVSLLHWRLHGPLFWVSCVPLVILIGCVLSSIRGFTLAPDAILIRRLFWTTRLARAGLRSAQFDPKAMNWSWRTFGNSGGFSTTGFYYNRRLGSYRAFVTDLRQTVVLRYTDHTVVLSPAPPEEFIRELGLPGPTV